MTSFAYASYDDEQQDEDERLSSLGAEWYVDGHELGLRRITHDYGSDSRIEAWTDFYCFATADKLSIEWASHYDRILVAASILSQDSTVKAFTALLRTKNSQINVNGFKNDHVYGHYGKTDELGYDIVVGDCGGVRQAIAISRRTRQDGARVVVVWPGQDVVDEIYHTISELSTVPVLPAWKDELVRAYREADKLLELEVYDPKKRGIQLLMLKHEDAFLEDVVRGLVTRGRVSIPDGFEAPPVDFNTVKKASEYLQLIGGSLASHLATQSRPLFVPGEDAYDPGLAELLRPPIGAQSDMVMGALRSLEHNHAAMIVAEMGSGKTQMANAIMHIKARQNGGSLRTLVVCPGQLVRKWQRECIQTIPGARVEIIETWRDVVHLRDRFDQTPVPGRCEVYILSRDRSKLSYKMKLQVACSQVATLEKGGRAVRFRRAVCPNCHAPVQIQKTDRYGERVAEYVQPEDIKTRRASNAWCSECKGSLWGPAVKPVAMGRQELHRVAGPDDNGPRRIAPDRFILRYLKGRFDLFVSDEVHEMAGHDTAQGNAFGALSLAAKDVLALTGTLLNGYASSLFSILFRIRTQRLLADGFGWGSTSNWISRYGVWTTVRDSKENYDYRSGTMSRRAGKIISRSESPGVSPRLFGSHLRGLVAFCELDDLGIALPEFREDLVQVGLGSEPSHGTAPGGLRIDDGPSHDLVYNRMETRLAEELRKEIRKGSKKMLGTYLQQLMAWPDTPWDDREVVVRVKELDEYGEVIGVKEEVLFKPPPMPSDGLYPKEEALLGILHEEISQGRKVCVYATYSGRRDVTERLRDIVRKAGYRVDVLSASVAPEKREDWILQHGPRVDVLIAQVDLVRTGLDLLDFPTLVFYQPNYSVSTLRQAARRSWRIGQSQPVRVVYLVYQGTMQERAINLMQKKIGAALAIEGRFSDEGFAALAENEDAAMALAKALVENLKDEQVEGVWNKVKAPAFVPSAPARPAPLPPIPFPERGETLIPAFGPRVPAGSQHRFDFSVPAAASAAAAAVATAAAPAEAPVIEPIRRLTKAAPSVKVVEISSRKLKGKPQGKQLAFDF